MKTGRKKAREDALQILYQLDLNHDMTPEGGIRYFEKHFMLPTHKQEVGQQEVGQFTHKLVSGVTERLSEIDSRLSDFADNWKTGRMPAVDRNILRLGVYELIYCDDVPSTVTINEMIELAKCFGAEESCAFVNGVLDKLSRNTINPNKAK